MTIEFIIAKGEEVTLTATLHNAVVEEIDEAISVLADGPFNYCFQKKDIIIEESDDEHNQHTYKLSDGREITITFYV